MNLHVPYTLSPVLPAVVEMAGSYMAAVAFTDFGDEEADQPPGDAEFSTEASLQAISDCAQFLSKAEGLLKQAADEYGYTMEQAGHDLWLTRNGHGAGFWDRGLKVMVSWGLNGEQQIELGAALTELADAYGSASVYQGDDGLVYFGG
jgi:hypothetical protein